MITRTVQCDRCGNPATQSFGEGGRGWYESYRCPSCGQAYEADGRSPAPEEFRRLILAQDGEWVFEVTKPPSTSLLKSLRELLGLSLRETQELKARLPGEVRRGTGYEMERLMEAAKPAANPGDLSVRRTDGR